jgi:hypothetical protein
MRRIEDLAKSDQKECVRATRIVKLSARVVRIITDIFLWDNIGIDFQYERSIVDRRKCFYRLL